jgi:hypothetical protein
MRRTVIRQLLLTALLPAVTVAFAVLSSAAPHLAASAGGAWSNLDVVFSIGLVVCLVLGVVCILETRATRIVGVFTVAVVLVFNPIAFAVALASFGLT